MKLALGTAQFGSSYGVMNSLGQVELANVKKIIGLARSSGLKTLDTAISYGNSEKLLGIAGVRDFELITKLPKAPNGSFNIETWVIQNIKASLLNLNSSKFYAVLFHHPDDLRGARGESIFNALNRLKGEGLIGKIGISIYDPCELIDLVNAFPLDLVQAPFSLVDRRLEESGYLQILFDLGIEIHVRSIFLQGLLLAPKALIPDKFNRWSFLWTRWNEWLIANSIKPSHACIDFVSSFEQINRVIVGVNSVEHFKELIEGFGCVGQNWPPISSSDLDLIDPRRWDVS